MQFDVQQPHVRNGERPCIDNHALCLLSVPDLGPLYKQEITHATANTNGQIADAQQLGCRA